VFDLIQLPRRPPEGGRYKCNSNVTCKGSTRLKLWQAGAQQAAPLPYQNKLSSSELRGTPAYRQAGRRYDFNFGANPKTSEQL